MSYAGLFGDPPASWPGETDPEILAEAKATAEQNCRDQIDRWTELDVGNPARNYTVSWDDDRFILTVTFTCGGVAYVGTYDNGQLLVEPG